MKRIALLVVFGWLLAAAVTETPVAHADTVAHTARWVCNQIALNPTPKTVEDIVIQLYAAGNTQDQEQQVMYYAMNITCPEYQPLAIQAALNVINNSQSV